MTSILLFVMIYFTVAKILLLLGRMQCNIIVSVYEIMK
jgi:hypothetical protein